MQSLNVVPVHPYKPSPALMRACNARCAELWQTLQQIAEAEPAGVEFFAEAQRRVLDRVLRARA